MREIVGAFDADVAPDVRALTDASEPLPAGAVFWPTPGNEPVPSLLPSLAG
ncbi:MAG: hypothetical protein Q8P18_01095 [Pseudomonadota bacterium]|nr:hypothetical protein [Pseudomonadota bacterium]